MTVYLAYNKEIPKTGRYVWFSHCSFSYEPKPTIQTGHHHYNHRSILPSPQGLSGKTFLLAFPHRQQHTHVPGSGKPAFKLQQLTLCILINESGFPNRITCRGLLAELGGLSPPCSWRVNRREEEETMEGSGGPGRESCPGAGRGGRDHRCPPLPQSSRGASAPAKP